MKWRIIYSLALWIYAGSAFAQGLYIKGNDSYIDERTSYVVFDKIRPVFDHQFSIDFEMAPMGEEKVFQIGYILRIKEEESHTIYNILYNSQDDSTVVKLNHEGKDVLLTAVTDRQKQYDSYWIRMHIDFDLQADSIHLDINGERFSAGNIPLGNRWKPVLYFGRSEHVIDILPFGLRNLVVGNREKKYSFPLNESEGELVHDAGKEVTGCVTHPVWLINDAYYWKEGPSFASRTVAGSNYNPDTHEMYYFNRDSVHIYNVRTKETQTVRYQNRCPVDMRLGTNFIDWSNRRLYAYEVADPPSGNVTVASLSLENYYWTVVSTQQLPIQLHHHSCFFDEQNRRYIIFGGFGNQRYSNKFYAFHLDGNYWDELHFRGDTLTPRYFTSLGGNGYNQVLYLFGGMGNESGDQAVGRVYYYELYKVDLIAGKITRLWSVPWKGENVVPVKGMVVPDDGSVYTLCYPEHFTHSSLQLYRFSIDDGRYQVFGDTVPILSEKITTHADLYYSKSSSELYTVVQEFADDDVASKATVYSLSFPPVTKKRLSIYTRPEVSDGLWLIAALLVGGGLLLTGQCVLLARRRKKAMESAGTEDPAAPPEGSRMENSRMEDHRVEDASTVRPNAIYLFGAFSLIDRNRREINYMLSTKLKQAFFLILGHTPEGGITSHDLSRALWPDKPEDKVKNSRGVALNNLRKILHELDGVSLIHENGLYRIVLTSECYCDYIHCREIASGQEMEKHLPAFVSILSKGKFLYMEDDPLLDTLKEYIERMLDPALFFYMEKAYLEEDYLAAISLCKAIFSFDPLNEEALRYILKSLVKMKLQGEAKRSYLLFTVDYKKTLGEEYPKPFADIIQ